jgi:predicted NBD/HSP70 family sugar kinase
LTDLLIGANLGAFVVAFVAGTAGVIAMGRAKSGAVVGVLVSITTIPAASNVGVALAMGSLAEAGQSLEILLVNLAGLLAGGVVTLLGTRVWARRIEAGQAIFRPKPGPGP